MTVFSLSPLASLCPSHSISQSPSLRPAHCLLPGVNRSLVGWRPASECQLMVIDSFSCLTKGTSAPRLFPLLLLCLLEMTTLTGLDLISGTSQREREIEFHWCCPYLLNFSSLSLAPYSILVSALPPLLAPSWELIFRSGVYKCVFMAIWFAQYE